jgi:hypothetical protein
MTRRIHAAVLDALARLGAEQAGVSSTQLAQAMGAS